MVIADHLGDAWPEIPTLTERVKELGHAAEVAVDQDLVDTGLMRRRIDTEYAETSAGEDRADGVEEARFGGGAI